MWKSASNAIASIGLKKNSGKNLVELSRASQDCSDDEVCSNASRDKGPECPICWESFNIVENVPYVLWCGHTLCKNWVLGLQLAVLKFPTQQIKIPYFVSCPWCHLMSFRLVCNGNLKFPRKNLVLNKGKKSVLIVVRKKIFSRISTSLEIFRCPWMT